MDSGEIIELSARLDADAQAALARGEEVLIIDYNQEKNLYTVAPVDKALKTLRKSL